MEDRTFPNRPPDVSLVFETANDRPDRLIRFADVAFGLGYESGIRGKPNPFVPRPRSG